MGSKDQVYGVVGYKQGLLSRVEAMHVSLLREEKERERETKEEEDRDRRKQKWKQTETEIMRQ